MKRLVTFTMLLFISCSVANAQPGEPRLLHEEIAFKSTGDVTLSGTLTLPDGEGPFPAIVLLGGSERLGRKAFYNWADGDSFARNGIAVFAFDSPGRGESEGDRWGRTYKERTDDALAAIQAIAKRADINENSIGLYGSSEGGSVTFRAAARSKSVAFGVAASAPAKSFLADIDSKVRTICLLSGLRAEKLDKLSTFNRLAVALALGHVKFDADALTKTVEKWNDPNWGKLISLLQNQTKQNREATREAFIEVAQKWESTDWFQRSRMLRAFPPAVSQLAGIDMSQLGVELSEPFTAKSLVEFDAAVVAKLRDSDSTNALIARGDTSMEDDPVMFLEKISCPILCIYGEKDTPMATYPDIVRSVFSRTKHQDWTVRVFKGAVR